MKTVIEDWKDMRVNLLNYPFNMFLFFNHTTIWTTFRVILRLPTWRFRHISKGFNALTENLIFLSARFPPFESVFRLEEHELQQATVGYRYPGTAQQRQANYVLWWVWHAWLTDNPAKPPTHLHSHQRYQPLCVSEHAQWVWLQNKKSGNVIQQQTKSVSNVFSMTFISHSPDVKLNPCY